MAEPIRRTLTISAERARWLLIHTKARHNLAVNAAKAADPKRSNADREWWALHAAIDRAILTMADKRLAK